ncbi:MAG: LptF/LptG family permease [Oceanipulchritudo sp.]
MNILSRYLAGSVIVTSLAGILVFVFILITGNAMRDILGLLAEGYIPLSLFGELLFLLVPYAFSFAMPLGMLIAILLVIGRLSANRELTALKSAGISIYAIAGPVLFVAICGSFVAAYINAVHAPAARASYRAILNDIVREDPLRFIVSRTFIHDFPGYIIYVGEKDRDRMKQFWLWELDEEKRAVRLLRADEGSFHYNEANDSLVLTLQKGFTELRDADNPDNLQEIQPTLSFRDARIRLPLASLLGTAHKPRKLKDFTVAELLQRREAARQLLETDLSPPEKREARISFGQYQYYISRHFAMAFSVFSLSVFAIPLGIRVSRTETYANFTLALVIAFGYYFAMIVIGWAEAKPHLRPELLVWLPNLAAQAIGFTLLARANRH